MKEGDIVAWSLINGWSLVHPNNIYPTWDTAVAYWRIKKIKTLKT